MEQGNHYPYSYSHKKPSLGTNTTRHNAAYQNSSAFSASANPDEDWTQISDLAERRRIQNRIAQRNYRKKLKRRLEDLEKKTVSSSASPEKTQRSTPNASSSSRSSASSREQIHRSTSRVSVSSHETRCSPDIAQSETWSNSTRSDAPPFAYTLSAPPVYSCSSYPPTTSEYFQESTYPPGAFPQMTANYGMPLAHRGFPQTTLSSMPPIMAYNNLETDTEYGRPHMFTPFDMTYASLNESNIPPSQISEEFELRTPALTDSMSYFDSSRECSPSYLEHSPLSGSPASPLNMQFIHS